MSAAGESGLRIVVATLLQGQRIADPHSAERDMRALNEGAGFDPQQSRGASKIAD
jgi:hypothetical protein